MNLKLWCYLIWLLYDWWLYFRNDILPIFLKWYFEITFIPSKKDCADHPFESTFISSLGQHNLWKQFFMPFVLKWYMTFISKWSKRSYLHFEMLYDCHFEMRGRKFSYTKLFSSRDEEIFYWRKCTYYKHFGSQLFTQGLVPILAFK